MDTPLPDRFLFTPPGYLLHRGPVGHGTDPFDVGRNVVRLGVLLDDGTKASGVPIFTDEDLALRFLKVIQPGAGDIRPIASLVAADLVTMMQVLAMTGAEQVMIDPGETNRGRTATIRAFIAGVERGDAEVGD